MTKTNVGGLVRGIIEHSCWTKLIWEVGSPKAMGNIKHRADYIEKNAIQIYQSLAEVEKAVEEKRYEDIPEILSREYDDGWD